jgi:hypothetical protein
MFYVINVTVVHFIAAMAVNSARGPVAFALAWLKMATIAAIAVKNAVHYAKTIESSVMLDYCYRDNGKNRITH